MIVLRNQLRAILLAIATLGMVSAIPPIALAAATFTVINNDSTGEGFNDPTPVAPVGGNTGTTIGQQRLIAFQHAANLWGARLTSSVAIRVRAQFDPQTCTATSAMLGSAGPINAFGNFAGAPVAGTWYAVALANALHGSDLDPAGDDINATFNSSIGTTCAFPNVWYYGLDGLAPSNRIDFVTVLLHELGHGLGFLTFVDPATGAKALGFNDAYMVNLERHGATPPDYPSMSNAQRVAASISTGNLHWIGANVRAASGALSAGRVGDHVRMFAPNPQQPGSSVSHFDTALTPNQLMEPFYTAPIHDSVLELALFKDLGWPNAAPLPTCTLTPNPSTIDAGQGATLAWTSTNATSGTITPTIGSVGPSGSRSVSPTQTTTYNGAFTGAGGTGNCSATISVIPVATIGLDVQPSGSGTVTGGGTFPTGTSRTVIATANPGFSFVNWTEGGTEVSTSASYSFTLNANLSLVAHFEASPTFTIGLGVDPEEAGSVSGDGTFPENSSQTVTATPNAGWKFVNWTEGGTEVSTSSSYTFTLNSNRSLVAHFEEGVTFNITTTANPPGSGSTTGDGTFPENSLQEVVATPSTAWTFANWTEGGEVVSTDTHYPFTLVADRDLTAHFVTKPTCTLSVTPPSIASGQSSRLIWTSKNATSGTIDHGVNAALPVAAGSASVSPTATTLYTGTFTSDGGDATCKTVVAVSPPHVAVNDAFIDFGSPGAYLLLNNKLTRIFASSPGAIGAVDLDGNGKDEVLAAFSDGLKARFASGNPVRLHSKPPRFVVGGYLDSNLKEDIVGDFPGLGILARMNNTGPWVPLFDHQNSRGLATGDLDGNGKEEVLAILSDGLWVRFASGNKFLLNDKPPLVDKAPLHVVTGQLDYNGKVDVVADFLGLGIYARMNNAGPWVKLRDDVSLGLATADLDGNGKDEVLVMLSNGLFARYAGGSFPKLRGGRPLHVIALSLDANAKDDIIADFTGGGILVRKNNASTWVRLDTHVTQGFVAGGFN